MYQRVKFVGALLCAAGALMLVLQPCEAKPKRVRLTILKSLLIVDSQGMDVIENAVELTKKAETKASKRVFMEDNHFIKRVAMVETSLNRSSKVGGLWNVDHCAFKTSQSKRKENKRLATLLKTVRRTFGVAWAKVRYSDLRRPLYSVLAARIILEMTERSVPRGLRNQAKFWLETYHACAQKSTQQQEDIKSKFIRVVKRSCHSELLKCEHFCREPANEKAECGCKGGYVLQSDGTSCAAGSSRSPTGTKAAEPQSTETGCGNGLKCEHKCIKYGSKSQCTCNNGYQLHMNGFSCVEKKINCSPNDIACIEKCSQSGNCSCPPGSVMSPDGETCVEVNECSLFRGVCHQNCVNTPRGYRCSCSQGYELDNNGISCTDIDECSRGSHGCHHNCRNVPGSYFCSCRRGFRLSNDLKTCVDINECALYPGTCPFPSRCRNTIGGHTCVCPKGFVMDRQKICVDENECAKSNGGCSQRCENFPGSFRCSCQYGFMLQADRKTCKDIDECKRYSFLCQFSCVNTPGGYKCSCPPDKLQHPNGFMCL